MIKVVIFDMDGLLVDSEPLWRPVVYKVYKKLGIEITNERHLMMTGAPALENARRLYKQYGWEGPSPEDVVAEITEEVIDLIKRDIRLMPGVHHALQTCKKAGLKVAIASSSIQAVIDAVVDTLEIREHFHHIYSAQFEEYGKPHPGVFLKVAGHFKVSPHECLVFEDSPNGILAAKSARMTCVAVPDDTKSKHPYVQTADAVIGSLEDFDEAMLKMLNQPGRF